MNRYHIAAGDLLQALAVALVVFTSGCTTGRGGLFNSATHRLLDVTKQLRLSSPMAMPLPRELDKGVLPAYFVEPGDTLLVQPANLESPVRLPSDQVVLPDGKIELGTYGRLEVVGKTPEQIEREVQEVVDARTPNAGPITVRLVGRQSKVFYVLGEVNSPGAYPLSGRETVLDAIIAAGGLTDSADTTGITFTRPSLPEDCRVVLPVCYNEIVQVGDTATNYQVAPGDRIYVPSMTLCQQLGQFLRPSPQPGCPPCGMCQYPCPDAPAQHIPPGAAPLAAAPEPLPTPAIAPRSVKTAMPSRR